MNEARERRQEKRRQEKLREEREKEPAGERGQKRKRALRHRQTARRIALIGVAVVILIFIAGSVTRLMLLKKEKTDVLKKQEQLLEEKKEKEKELENVDSLENLEEQARRIKLIKPGETLFVPEDGENK